MKFRGKLNNWTIKIEMKAQKTIENVIEYIQKVISHLGQVLLKNVNVQET